MRWKRGAIDLDEPRLRLRARVMQRPRDEILARPALAEEQHRRVRDSGDASHELAHLFYRRPVAEDGAGGELGLAAALEGCRLLAHRPFVDRPPQLRQ